MIYNKKLVLYRKATFDEDYDNTIPHNEVRVSDLTASVISEELGTKYLDLYRELDEQITTGREKGKLTFSKNWDNALMKSHTELIESALGTIYGGVALTTAIGISGVGVPEISTIEIGTDWQSFVGHPVTFKFGDRLTNINFISGADATHITLEYPLTDKDRAVILDGIADGSLEAWRRPYIALGETNDMSYHFVVLFDDSTCSVFRGSGITASFQFNKKGKAEIKFEVQSAKFEDKNDAETAMLPPVASANIVNEDPARTLMYIFQNVWINYGSPVALQHLCPQSFDLKINGKLEADECIGGLNNIQGWYSTVSMKADAKFKRTTPVNLLFTRKLENQADTGIFFSQKDCAYKSYATFTNRKTEKNGAFDSLVYKTSVNSTRVAPIFVPPVELFTP